jgi:hypothetical protein
MRHISLLLALTACAHTGPVRPDDMSADSHRREASRLDDAARAELDAYRPNAVTGVDTSTPLFYPMDIYNPTSYHLDEAARLAAHAREHESAAAELERFEQAECKDFPPATRAACPLLGPVVARKDVADGVLLELTPAIDTTALVAHMRCHLAYARTRGFVGLPDCPLYLRGVRVDRAGPHSIVITTDDPIAADKVRADAQEIAP